MTFHCAVQSFTKVSTLWMNLYSTLEVQTVDTKKAQSVNKHINKSASEHLLPLPSLRKLTSTTLFDERKSNYHS